MNSPLHFALIGCGHAAALHIPCIKASGRLVAVCDTDMVKAEAMAAAHNCTPYNDLDELLAKEPAANVVVICTPNGTHAVHVIKSLQAGRHVICENPLCLTSAGAWQIVETARLCGRQLVVAQYNLLLPAVQQALKWINDKALGEILSFQLNAVWNSPTGYYENTWRSNEHLGGGILYTPFGHIAEIIHCLFGPAKNCSGVRRNSHHQQVFPFEDSGVISLEMESGTLGGINYHVNADENHRDVTLTIYASKGNFIIDLYDGEQEDWDDSHNYLHQIYVQALASIADSSIPTNAYAALRTTELIAKIYEKTPLL
jgi:UDP-N-acetyl-2-amino-2-deoxyglucuronate dehydrogenase